MFSKNHISLAASAAFLSKAQAGKCPFGFDSESDSSNLTSSPTHPQVQNTSPNYPVDIFTCTGTAATTTDSGQMTAANYEAIVRDVNSKYESVADTIADNTNPRAKFAACIVRTVGHDFMDYRNSNGAESGGADGCMAFADADNTGLPTCLTNSGLVATYNTFCDKTSLADFLVIAGEAVMGRTSPTYNKDDYYAPGTLAKVFKDNFKFGRTTATTCSEAEGRMPNPENGCDGLKSIFVDHVYASQTAESRWSAWDLTAAISGAHTLGSATIANSGYDGFWADATQSGIFNNDYYKGILHKGWGVERAINGNANKNQFKRIDLDADQLTHKEMMLSTDMCLAMNGDPGTGGGGDGSDDEDEGQGGGGGGGNGGGGPSSQAQPLLAQTHDCCAWVEVNNLGLQGGQAFCGGILNDGWGSPKTSYMWNFWDADNRDLCCASESPDSFGDCDNENSPNGPAKDAVFEFAEDEAAFINGYVRAWNIATENGFTGMTAIGDGNGLATFDNAHLAAKVTQSCEYSFWACEATLFQCIGNWWGARKFCSSEGENGRYSYDWGYADPVASCKNDNCGGGDDSDDDDDRDGGGNGGGRR